MRRFLPRLLVATMLVWLGSCAKPRSAGSPEDVTDKPAEIEEPAPAAGGACADVPYVQRAGAAQDAFTSPTNFLRCTEGQYALCYYSGADPLPCKLDNFDATGYCECQVFVASDDAPMYVEIGGILNQCVYDETVTQCSEDGSGCQNICIDKPHAPGCGEGSTTDLPVAAVCDYIADGTFNRAAEFISTFSLETVSVPETGKPFSLGSNDEQGRYAGCMTAPCTGQVTDGKQNLYTTCGCPLWPPDPKAPAQPYQFGRKCIDGEQDPLSPGHCGLRGDQVWSAAVNEAVTQSLHATE